MLKINSDTNRLTKEELEDYRENSGITERQYQIIKKRYHDKNEPSIIAVCMDLNISQSQYNRDLRKALNQIYKYEQKKNI